MKIVHIITGLSMGGAERALFNLLSGGLANKFDCHVVSMSDLGVYGAQICELGVAVHTLDMPRGRVTFTGLSTLRRVIRRVRPQILQGWMYHGNIGAFAAQKIALERVALLWNIRQSLYGLSAERPLTRQVIRANSILSRVPDVLLYNSHLSRQQHEAFGFFGARSSIVPNGFDLDKFRPANQFEREARQELEIPFEALVVGHVARFHPMKDHARFVRVATRLATSCEDLHVLLIGSGVTVQNSTLLDLVPYRLRSRFHFLGERDDVHRLLRTMNVFCQSSWSEAFPNVLGEAMACGVPCVATNVGDSARVVGDTGVIVAPSDDSALLDGLTRMLALAGDVRAELGSAARARIEKHYGLDSVVERYVELYHGLS